MDHRWPSVGRLPQYPVFIKRRILVHRWPLVAHRWGLVATDGPLVATGGNCYQRPIFGPLMAMGGPPVATHGLPWSVSTGNSRKERCSFYSEYRIHTDLQIQEYGKHFQEMLVVFP